MFYIFKKLDIYQYLQLPDFVKNNTPKYLIYMRLLLGFLVPIIAYSYGESAKNGMVILVIVGFLADILDGIVARKLNVSNVQLRIADSIVDRIFWLCSLFACYLFSPGYILSNFWPLAIVLGGDVFVYIVSIIRFKKIPSPHNLLTKLWGILIAISIIEIFIMHYSVLFNIMIVVGIISRIDSLLIYIFLKKWDHDIPSCYHAYQLRLGRQIKRHKLFNG